MTPHIPEELSARIDWSPFAIMGNTMPPRDPDEEDEEDEDGEGERADEPAVVRTGPRLERRGSGYCLLVRWDVLEARPSRTNALYD